MGLGRTVPHKGKSYLLFHITANNSPRCTHRSERIKDTNLLCGLGHALHIIRNPVGVMREDEIEARNWTCSHKGKTCATWEEKVHREKRVAPDPFWYFTVKGSDKSLQFRGQDRRERNSGGWMQKKNGSPKREMLLLCLLPALDTRRLEVGTPCFVTLMCLQSTVAGLQRLGMGHRVTEIMIPSAQGHGAGLGQPDPLGGVLRP